MIEDGDNSGYSHDKRSVLEEQEQTPFYRSIQHHSHKIETKQPDSLKQECEFMFKENYFIFSLVSELNLSSPEESPISSLSSSTGLLKLDSIGVPMLENSHYLFRILVQLQSLP